MCDYRLAEPPVWTQYDPAGILSKENTLDWVRRFYAGMAEGNQPPRGLQSPPSGPGGLTMTLERAMVEIQTTFRREMDGIIESLRQVRDQQNTAGTG